METKKTCSCCKELKKTTEFGNLKSSKDGLMYQCKECRTKSRNEYRSKYPEKRKEYYQSNKSKIDEKNKQWKIDNIERHKENQRIYYEKNKDKLLNRSKRRWIESKDEIKKYKKRYREENKERLRAKDKEVRNRPEVKLRRQVSNNKRVALKKSTSDGSVTTSAILELKRNQGEKCVYCMASIAKSFHIDHIYPLAKKGTHTIDNIQLLCPTCNIRKNAKDPLEYANEIGRLF